MHLRMKIKEILLKILVVGGVVAFLLPLLFPFQFKQYRLRKSARVQDRRVNLALPGHEEWARLKIEMQTFIKKELKTNDYIFINGFEEEMKGRYPTINRLHPIKIEVSRETNKNAYILLDLTVRHRTVPYFGILLNENMNENKFPDSLKPWINDKVFIEKENSLILVRGKFGQ